MANIRRLQHISNQYLLNIPAHFAKYASWQKGDYLEVIEKGKDALEIRKIATKEAPRDDVNLAALEQEASGLSALINAGGALMSPGDYSARLSRFSYVASRARKLRQKMYIQVR